MRGKRNRYAEMERSFGLVLLINILLFIFYLMAAAKGIIWLKITLFIATFLLATVCLLLLYYAGELGRQRSLWLVSIAAVIAICVLFSIILNYPSPNPYKQGSANPPAATTSAES